MSSPGGSTMLGGVEVAVRASQDQLTKDLSKIRSQLERDAKSIQARVDRISLSRQLSKSPASAAKLDLSLMQTQGRMADAVARARMRSEEAVARTTARVAALRQKAQEKAARDAARLDAQTVARQRSIVAGAAGGVFGIGKQIASTAIDVGIAGAAVGIGAATAVIAVGSKTAAEFEAQMTSAATLFGIFEKSGSGAYEALQNSAIQLGAQTQFSASQVAAAFEVLGQAGFSVNEAMSAMPNVLGLAAAGGMGVADAAGIAAATLNNFALETTELERVNDSLAMAANKSNVNMADLSYSLKYTAPIAKAVGVEMEDLLAVIAKMGDAGIKGEMAGTSLRSVLSKLSAPTKQAREEFAALGIDIANFGKAGGPGLFDVLDRLQGMDAARLSKLFDRESMAGLMGLLQRGGFRQLAGEMRAPEARGSARRMAAAKMDTTKGDFEQMKGSLESLAIAVFQPINQNLFRPAMQAATTYFEGIASKAMNSQQQISLWAAQMRDILTDVGKGVMEAGRLGMGAMGGGGMVGLDDIEGFTSNWDLAWEKMGIKAAIVFTEMKANFAAFIEFATQGTLELAATMGKMLGFATNPANWGEGFVKQLDAMALDGLAKVFQGARAAGDKVRADDNLPGMKNAFGIIDKQQKEAVEGRRWERVAPILEAGAKNAWQNMMLPFVGGGGNKPVEVVAPPEVEARQESKRRQSQSFGLADFAKHIQQSLLDDGMKDIAKDQLAEQKDAVKELKEIKDELKNPKKPQPAAVV